MSLQVLIDNEMLADNGFDIIKSNNKSVEKYKKFSKTRKLLKGLKLFKSGNLKSKKSSKCQKLAKSKKKLSKNGNLLNFNAKKNVLSFLTLETRAVFNCLRLAFTKAPIL